jgi:ABC-type antimicrobial peptide transport system permease subunit
MLQHFIKIAFRNMWKYKGQTLVSVVGLAVGFACFAMAALWIRYEMTYDSFHPNADRIYCVSIPDAFTSNNLSRSCPYPLAGYLKATFPEIANSISITSSSGSFEVDGIAYNADFIQIDSSFFNMFDVKIVGGSMTFLIPESKNIAVTDEKAKQLFGNENPLGKTVKLDGNDEYTIGAIVTGLPKRSNYPFDILQPLRASTQWNFSSKHTLIELVPGIDIKAFKKKLFEHTIRQEDRHITQITLMPLTSVHYRDPNIYRDVKFQHIIIFAVAGLLLILCTLFNCLTLFISRFRIRQREFALRIVCGASNRSLFSLLSVEFLASLVIALLLGTIFIHTISLSFQKLSGIKLELYSIYLESIIYIAGIILISLLSFIVIFAMFRRRTLNTNIHGNNRKLFRKISIVFQLIISIVFSFCTIIILKQMYHLHNTDLGFAVKNCGSVVLYGKEFDIHGKINDETILDDKIRQIPEITETVKGYIPLLPMSGRMSFRIAEWEDKSETAEPVNIEAIDVSEQFLAYYKIKLVEGELLNDHDTDKDVLINESAAKFFGWHNSVGKTFRDYNEHTCTVKGVIKNIYNMSPVASAKPVYYRLPRNSSPINIYVPPTIMFKYNEGAWKTCRKKIEEIVNKEYPDTHYMIYSSEEEYDKFLKSENTLLQVLTLISLVCVIVCIFGFVSIVLLTCEERRKEIAIRKINGATVKDILDIFFKEYLSLLAAGALIAFPVGYIIMKRWLEQYVVQTEISAWVYIAILFALIMVIVVSVGGRVYKTSSENPINAIK